MAGFISEWWTASNRNGGRLQIGIGGRIASEFALAGDQVIWWLRERCGKSEEVHSAMKSDLAGGQMPSGLFGANAAWWALTILAFNLNAAMKRLALGEKWEPKRMKALRYHRIGLPGRVVAHARQLIIRLGGGAEALATVLDARRRIGRWRMARPDERKPRVPATRHPVHRRSPGRRRGPLRA